MNRTTLLFLLPVAFLGFACERHSADSLPKHEGEHGKTHSSAPSFRETPVSELPGDAAPALRTGGVKVVDRSK